VSIDVLIAEDEPAILDSLEFILRRAGFSVASVTDGAAAFAEIRRQSPKVVVLDVMLPRQSGFEVLKQIRADVAFGALPVLMLTAKGQQQDKRIAEELGADAFVTKPYANADVVRSVQSLMTRRGLG
jgi:two-component system, OmpR family, response regulator